MRESKEPAEIRGRAGPPGEPLPGGAGGPGKAPARSGGGEPLGEAPPTGGGASGLPPAAASGGALPGRGPDGVRDRAGTARLHGRRPERSGLRRRRELHALGVALASEIRRAGTAGPQLDLPRAGRPPQRHRGGRKRQRPRPGGQRADRHLRSERGHRGQPGPPARGSQRPAAPRPGGRRGRSLLRGHLGRPQGLPDLPRRVGRHRHRHGPGVRGPSPRRGSPNPERPLSGPQLERALRGERHQRRLQLRPLRPPPRPRLARRLGPRSTRRTTARASTTRTSRRTGRIST
jgi:hypothetical protein